MERFFVLHIFYTFIKKNNRDYSLKCTIFKLRQRKEVGITIAIYNLIASHGRKVSGACGNP